MEIHTGDKLKHRTITDVVYTVVAVSRDYIRLEESTRGSHIKVSRKDLDKFYDKV